MTSRDFCYWLQGFFELKGKDDIVTPNQIQIIRNHLNMVFKHEIDPSMGDAAHQTQLQELHGGGSVAASPPQSVVTVKPHGNLMERPRC